MLAFRRLGASAVLVATLALGCLILDGQGGALGQAAALIHAGESAGAASPEVVLPADLTPAERRDLLARLTDAQVRALLLQHLDLAAGVEGAEGRGQAAGFVQDFEGALAKVRDGYGQMFAAIDDLPGLPPLLFSKLTEDKDPSILFWVMVAFAMMILVGFGAEWAFGRVTAGYRRQIETATVDRLMAKFGYLSLRVVMDLLGVVVFGLAALGVFFLFYQGHGPTRYLVLTYLWAVVLVRAIVALSRFLLAPKAPALRMVALDDDSARLMHAHVVSIVTVGTFGMLTGGLLQLLGVEQTLNDLLLSGIGVIMMVMLLLAIWQVREPIAALIRGETQNDDTLAGRARRIVANLWHMLAMIYVVAIWGMASVGRWVFEQPTASRGIGSLLIVVAVPLIDTALRRGLTGFFAERREGGPAADLPASATLTPAENIILRGLRIVLLLAAVVVFARLWGIKIFALSSAGLGAEMTRGIVEVGATLLLAHLLWELAKSAIDRRLREEGGGTGHVEAGSEGGGAGSRIKTLLPLFRKFLLVTILVMATMIALSAMGVQIGPLLAGAGVIGIAIGFGAQTLVRDVVSGVFFLLDDAFRTGEYVDVGAAKGVVERITVRSLILRHHLGTLNIVPFGEIQHLSNFSRDWVIMKLRFRVTYDTDVNKVKKIFKQIGAELMEDEILGPGFIEPLKSQGVLAMEDSAMIVRAKFMAKPGQQFMIRKEAYRRIQEEFKKHGIEFAHREVTVHVPGVSDLAERDDRSPEGPNQPETSAQREAIKEAASAAALAVLAEEEEQAEGKAPG